MNLKGKKLLVSIVAIAVTLCIAFGQAESYAYTDLQSNPFWVNLKEVRSGSNTAYAIGDPSAGQGGKKIWDLVSYASNTSSTSTNKNLYCVKGGFGTTWNSRDNGGTEARVAYKKGYNIRTDKSQIDNFPSTQSVYKNITGTYYNQILWVLDNMYVPTGNTTTDTANKTALLTAAGVDFTNTTRYSGMPLTDDDIEVVQQLVLWYYTNNGDSTYSFAGTNKDMIKNALNIKNSNTVNQDWQTYSTVHQNTDGYGPKKTEQMDALYKYLIRTAESNASKYTQENQYQIGSPITVDTQTTMTITENGDYYIVGPVKITENTTIPYTLNLTVKNGSGSTISGVTYPVTTTGTTTSNMTNFYLKVPKSAGNKINVDISASYTTSDATLWIPGTDNLEQPIIEVLKKNNTYTASLSTEVPEEKPFDLALRKFITKITDSNGNIREGSDYNYASRVPQVGAWTVDSGTTALKSHSKTTLKVANGDLIEYTIRVYNEGELAGYAEQITDYILNNQGLEFVEGNSTNQQYRWTKSGNKVTTDYLSRSQGNTSNLLSAYNGSNLDYRDIKIVFRVTEPNSSNNTLVNIAEITKAKDKDGNDKNNAGDDRDSTPGSDKRNYPSNGYNTENHEDDIDYEPVVLKQFDLALRKFITAVSSDATIDADDYLTGTKSREPVVTYQNNKLVYTHPKNTVAVKDGDYVLYTIRVYNEGEVNGYVEEITDKIPDGLEFINSLDENIMKYNGYWTQDANDPSIIRTDRYAKGKWLEENVENANLLEAFDKNSSITNTNPHYKDVQVLLRVKQADSKSSTLTNYAQISADSDDDIDSTPGNGYFNDEDDEDYDPVALQTFDLSLRKYISKVDGDEPATNRAPVEDTSSLIDGTTATYNHTKTPLEVVKGKSIIYTIRVYNEGDVDGYASKVTDHLPPYLEFVPKSESEINTKYEWEISTDGRTATTEYLADNSQLIKAREANYEANGSLSTSNPYKLYYKYVEIECKVKDNAIANQNITNIAEISEYRDANKAVVNPDRDSRSDNVSLPTDENLPGYKDDQIANQYVPGQQDDDDFEKVYVKDVEQLKFDLALRKFITAVNGTELTGDNSREPEIAMDGPVAVWGHDNGTTATKNHTKTPLTVSTGDTVRYTMRVYNEGQVSGTATEITDYLPDGLEFLPDSEINKQYKWKANGQTVTTDYLKDHPIRAVGDYGDPYYEVGLFRIPQSEDVQIECKVVATEKNGNNLRNIAAITADTGDDIDSSPDLNPSNNSYNPTDGGTTGKGEEDDDDFEDLNIVKPENPIFDLSLRKFITNISGTEETSRIPQVDAKALTDGTSTTATYTHPKDAMVVKVEDTVTYTIRVYNEGDIDGYVEELADDMPKNLTFLPDNTINTTYGWKMYDEQGNETDDVSKAVQIKTTYLSKANEKTAGDNLLKAFDKTAATSETNPNYKEVKVAFKVNKDAPSGQIITNKAQIIKHTDKDGNDITDRDSTPNKWIEGEDDQDIENITPKQFDLALLKYVSQVIVTEDGNTTTTNTGNTGADTDIIPKVEINRKKINSTTVKFVYTIKVANEGNVAGYAYEITDYVPEGLQFVAEDNPNWTAKGNGVIATRALEKTLLQPGESAPVTVVFTWINGTDNMGLKTNIAEISEDSDDDIDSTPNNQVKGEDDLDTADVLLSIKTGKVQTYFILGGAALITLASGIAIIRRFVL